jgi:hypothetical protein
MRLFAIALASSTALAMTVALAAGCSSSAPESSSGSDQDITRDPKKDDVWIYNGLLPHLTGVHITASIAGSTARVTGYAPKGFTGPLPYYAQSSQDETGTLITVVYPIATAAIGTKNPDGTPVMNRPGTYPNLVVTPFKTEGSPSEWGGFPYMEYNHVHEDAFHGPISYPVAEQWQLRRGPVSHGCSRMQGEHAVELANLIGIDMLENHSAGERVTVNLTVDLITGYDQTPDGKYVDVDYPITGTWARPPAAKSTVWPTWNANDYPQVVCPLKTGRPIDELHCQYEPASKLPDIMTVAQAEAAASGDDDSDRDASE